MNLKHLKKINSLGIKHQGYRTRICPECNSNLDQHEDYRNAIGWDILCTGRHILIFECPKCFTKSFLHCDENFIKSVDELIDTN